MTHVAFSFTSALLLATEPSVLGNSNQGYLSPSCALCQAASPSSWMGLISTAGFGSLAFLFLGLACDLCLDMFETAEAQGVLRYYLCFPLLCLLVSISSGRHILNSCFVLLYIFWVFGFFFVFIFGLISCFSIYVSSKTFLKNRNWKCLLCTRGCSENSKYLPGQIPFVKGWTVTFSVICHKEGALEACCRHPSRCHNSGQDVCSLVLCLGWVPFLWERVHQIILQSHLLLKSSQGNRA